METKEKNKMITGKEARNKSEEQRTEQEYHFSGGLEYEPLTVKAGSPEEAQALWASKRKKVEN